MQLNEFIEGDIGCYVPFHIWSCKINEAKSRSRSGSCGRKVDRQSILYKHYF